MRALTTQDQLEKLMELAKFSERTFNKWLFAESTRWDSLGVEESARWENTRLLPLLTAQNEALKIALEALQEINMSDSFYETRQCDAASEALESIRQLLEGAVR